MADYQTNAQELAASAFKDAPKAATLLTDIADEQINLGAMEPIEDAAMAALKPYLTGALAKVQEEMGVYAQFAGDMADNPEGAVDFLLGKIDEMVEAGSMEPLMDSVAQMARPFLVNALAAQQAKLAAVAITAED